MINQLVTVPLVLSFILSTAITYLTIIFYRGFGLVDKSTDKDHPKNIHSIPVPRGGGIPIYLAMLFATLVFTKFDQQMAGIFVGATILLVLGILDDLMNLSPYLRLLLGGVASFIVVLSGIGIKYVSNPFGGIINLDPWLASLLAIVWIMWAMNFVNMGAKGLDGQLPGVVAISAIVVGILSFRFANDMTSWSSSYLAFSLAGAYLGLLIFNIYPQKIMPGWGGGSLAGYFLAVLAILSGAKVATVAIVLGVPLIDVVYAIMRRILSGKSPVWGDNLHLHHQLLKLGFSKRMVAFFYWVITAVLGFMVLQLNSREKIYTIIMLLVLVGGMLLWINLFLSQKKRELHNG